MGVNKVHKYVSHGGVMRDKYVQRVIRCILRDEIERVLRVAMLDTHVGAAVYNVSCSTISADYIKSGNHHAIGETNRNLFLRRRPQAGRVKGASYCKYVALSKNNERYARSKETSIRLCTESTRNGKVAVELALVEEAAERGIADLGAPGSTHSRLVPSAEGLHRVAAAAGTAGCTRGWDYAGRRRGDEDHAQKGDVGHGGDCQRRGAAAVLIAGGTRGRKPTDWPRNNMEYAPSAEKELVFTVAAGRGLGLRTPGSLEISSRAKMVAQIGAERRHRSRAGRRQAATCGRCGRHRGLHTRAGDRPR